jgi:hypothetical protein
VIFFTFHSGLWYNKRNPFLKRDVAGRALTGEGGCFLMKKGIVLRKKGQKKTGRRIVSKSYILLGIW